jgi:hypothetical protein
MAADGDSGGPKMPNQAIIALCLVGAGASVLIAWALFRHFFDDDKPKPEGNRVGEDGYTQAQYMRMVRLRNQEALQAKYGFMNNMKYPSQQNSHGMTQSSFTSSV